ncbi:hypothetical protein [Kutzneria chonburiensis]|uniref:DUF3558 domain-containing protein n=1 Tax=Kutzneria chonburiensis TaxID=1483604 RepID=A0ABV6MV00_9PSEU|nr:hypothetical protein [Kutzneria chonburiensis]
MLRLACAVLAAVALLTACSPNVDTTRSVAGRNTVTGQPEGNTAAMDPAFTETKLRLVDPCALLDDKLLAAVGTPDGKPHGDPFQGCKAQVTVDDVQNTVTVTLGDAVPEWDRDALSLAGMRVLEARQTGSCTDKAVTQASPTRAVVVRAEVKGGEPCAVARQVLTGVIARIRTAPPRVPMGSSVMAGQDPCLLVDRATIFAIVPGGDPKRDSESLYDCAWRQKGVTLEVYGKIGSDPSVAGFDAAPTPVDLGGGVTAYRSDTSAGYPSCTLKWADRPMADGVGEIVTVYVANGQKLPDFDTCAKAVVAGKIVVANLPKS